jgi:hypothetical protein
VSQGNANVNHANGLLRGDDGEKAPNVEVALMVRVINNNNRSKKKNIVMV